MSPLRILHVVPYFEGAWAYGGIPRLATAMARGLARRGHRVTVCTTDAGDERTRWRGRRETDRARDLDVHVFPNVSNALAYHWQMFTPVGLSGFVRRTASSFDIAHLHACRNLPGILAARGLRRAGVPYVLSPNGTAPIIERRVLAKRVLDALGARRVLDEATRVVAVTDAERRQLLALGVTEDRIVIVPNPLDVREFEPPPDRGAFRDRHGLGDQALVLFLGKLTPRKGVEVLVRAFARTQTRGARLVIAGNDMGAGSSVAAAIDETGVAARVARVGLLRGRERLDAIAAADVVVYPSRDEVFGLVPLEALVAGTPVVVCSDSGCAEVIGRTGGGHLVPYGDAAVLAGAIDSVLGQAALWRVRAAAAGRRARELFGADEVCGQLEVVYRELAAAPPRRGPLAA
jgi:glycosyltransferase involved in cell wall biosynthesis